MHFLLPVEKQIAIIYLGTRGLLGNIPVEKVKEFEDAFLTYLETNHRDVLDSLRSGQLTDEVTATLEKVGADMSKQYKV